MRPAMGVTHLSVLCLNFAPIFVLEYTQTASLFLAAKNIAFTMAVF